MRTPDEDASLNAHRRYGRYSYKLLFIAGYKEMAIEVDTATKKLVVRWRAVEDLEDPLQEALAVRDHSDHLLDDLARDARAALAGRWADAARESPYTDIFPNGIDEYTEADLKEQETRYETLVKRINTFLDPDDDIRLDTPKAITEQLELWKKGVSEVSSAESDIEVARAVRQKEIDDWERVMLTTYGELLGMVGKAKAERFFQKIKSKKKKKAAKTEPAPPPETGSETAD